MKLIFTSKQRLIFFYFTFILSFFIFLNSCSESRNRIQSNLISLPFIDSLALSEEKINVVIDSLRAELRKATTDSQKICLLNELANEYVKLKPEVTISIAQQVLQLSQHIKFNYGYTEALNNQGLYYYYINKYDSALACYNRCLKLIESKNLTQNDEFVKLSEASAIYGIGNVYRFIGEPDAAIEYFNKSFQLYENIKTNNFAIIKKAKKGITISLNGIGLIYGNIGDYAKALEYYYRSLKISEEIGDKSGIAVSLTNIGNIYINQGDYSKALDYHSKSLKIREEICDKVDIAISLSNIGIIYYMNQSDYLNALEYFKKAVKINEEIGNKFGISKSLNNIGIIYKSYGDIQKALECYHKSLKIQEEIGYKEGVAASLNNIGIIYKNLGDIQKALEYHYKSLKIKEEIGDKKGITYSLSNIGVIYKDQGNYQKALEYQNKSLKIKEEIGDKFGISVNLTNIGVIYEDQKDYQKALYYYYKSLKIDEEIGNKNDIAASLFNIGIVYLEMNQLAKALICAQKAYNLAKEIGYVEAIRNASGLLERIYSKLGNYKLSRQYFEEYIIMRDSLSNEENKKLAQKKYYQYQYDKKAATDSIAHAKAMEIAKLELEHQKSESRKQRIILWFVAISLLLVAVIAIVIFRSLRVTRKQKNIIEKQKQIVDEQNLLLNKQNEEIRVQRDEIAAQRDIVTKQKEQIEEIHKELTDSINYAKRIQDAILPVSEEVKYILGEHFILYKPKDIVSGDFYWTVRINEWLIIAVADCTGHGVPGAFMSMLGISFLNEIVRKKEITQANQVLNELRKEVVNALQQKGELGEQRDGMDISLLVINIESKESQWSGANNSLYLIRNKRKDVPDSLLVATVTIEDNCLYELKGDNMPVGIYERMDSFTNRNLKLEKGDCIYLFSDGYADQFGGTDGKKFKYKQFKELLLLNYQKPMHEQKAILEKTMTDWIGTAKQIDDITVLGLRICE